jgi:hypothetical protein
MSSCTAPLLNPTTVELIPAILVNKVIHKIGNKLATYKCYLYCDNGNTNTNGNVNDNTNGNGNDNTNTTTSNTDTTNNNNEHTNTCVNATQSVNIITAEKYSFGKEPVNKYVLLQRTNPTYDTDDRGRVRYHTNNKDRIHYPHYVENTNVYTLFNVIGPVTELSCYLEYRLYCLHLWKSNYCLHLWKSNKRCGGNQQQDRTKWRGIITIDNDDTEDYDDAIGYRADTNTLSVYIANVPQMLDQIPEQNINVWGSLIGRNPATIYLGPNTRPMIPHNEFALTAKQDRLAVHMDIALDSGAITFGTSIIRVSANCRYGSVHSNKYYGAILKATEYLFSSGSPLHSMATEPTTTTALPDPHTLVAKLMILMNSKVGDQLALPINLTDPTAPIHPTTTNGHCGIFRKLYVDGGTFNTNTDTNMNVVNTNASNNSNNTHAQIKWKNMHCLYTATPSDHAHEMLCVDHYAHSTSPIRRQVDIVNLIELQQKLGLYSFSDQALQYCVQYKDQLSNVNQQLKSIKKVQSEYVVLSAIQSDPNRVYSAEIIEPVVGIGVTGQTKDQTQDQTQYRVYVPALNYFGKVFILNTDCSKVFIINTNSNVNIGAIILVKACIFANQASYYGKIRLYLA